MPVGSGTRGRVLGPGVPRVPAAELGLLLGVESKAYSDAMAGLMRADLQALADSSAVWASTKDAIGLDRALSTSAGVLYRTSDLFGLDDSSVRLASAFTDPAAKDAWLASLNEPMSAFQEAVQAANKRAIDEITAGLDSLSPKALIDSAWLANFGSVRAHWPGEQLADLLSQFNTGQMADILIGRQAPAVISRPEPPPQPPVKRLPPPKSGIEPAQPGQPVDWQQALADALQLGLTTPDRIVQWLLQLERGSQQPPQWEYIELIALDYKRTGHHYENLAAFARKHRLHRATVDRYLKMYEAATGERVRPGQGRARRSSNR